MTLLKKGMYGSEFDQEQDAPFGLKCGQMRSDDTIHNGGWYNILGAKLGWGDLSIGDITRIKNELPKDECFIVLSESDSFWKFVRNVAPLGFMCDVDEPSERCPGTEYVLEKAMFLIVPGTVYCCNYRGDTTIKTSDYCGRTRDSGSVPVTFVPREKLIEIARTFL